MMLSRILISFTKFHIEIVSLFSIILVNMKKGTAIMYVWAATGRFF